MIVRGLLLYIAKITGLSYNEINIITYYYIIPFFYLTLIDYKLDIHILKTSFLILGLISIMLIKDFNHFSDQLFIKSVNFLQSFEIVGWNYIVSSVIICVIIPIALFIIILII